MSNNDPIGIFDSGYGGLTVLREIVSRMPNEDVVFLGDSARCPYGPRSLDEVEGFVLQICNHLMKYDCKLIVIACNTATAAGLKAAQMAFNVPIVGVVAPGARAAVHMTRNRKVGVIATQGTVDSGVYERAIHNLDAGIEVVSMAAPKFVDIAEAGLQFAISEKAAAAAQEASGDAARVVHVDAPVTEPEIMEPDDIYPVTYREIADEYLLPLRESGIDTLVMGCTHFPLIKPLIRSGVGPDVALVSSAEETAAEVQEILGRRGDLADKSGNGSRKFLTTGQSASEFGSFGELVMEAPIADVSHVTLGD